MAQSSDLGKKTVREVLTKELGEATAEKVLKAVNDAYDKGKSGEELKKLFADLLKQEGYDVSTDTSFGCAIVIP